MASERSIDFPTVRIQNQEYVIIPRREFERLASGIPAGSVEAVPYMIQSIARGLRTARQIAGLTQAELARKLRKSQAMVSAAETGRVQVGERFIKAVLRACGLPLDWKPPAPKPARKPSPR
jgi:ribosome-binding protein aMBF1 (putative translation factor)